MISNEKALKYDTWRQFERICAFIIYSFENFDYFQTIENYVKENNIDK